MMVLLKLIEGLWIVTYLTGLLVTVVYFHKHGKVVFILLLIYFALGVYAHTLARHVDRFLMRKSVGDISQEQLDKYKAYEEESEHLYLKHFGTIPGHTTTAIKRIQFLFGQILLVTTLFLLGRRLKQKIPNQNPEDIVANHAESSG